MKKAKPPPSKIFQRRKVQLKTYTISFLSSEYIKGLIMKEVIKLKRTILIIPFTSILFLQSCKDSPNQSEFNTDTTRIVIGQSIEGIKIGDDSLTVINKLGIPDTIYYADLDGWVFAYINDDNQHRRLRVVLINNPTFISKSSAVISVEIGRPFPGKTKEGVRINMNREEVIKRLGNPQFIDPDSPPYVDYYIYEPSEGYFKTIFLFTYDSNEVLLRIRMDGP